MEQIAALDDKRWCISEKDIICDLTVGDGCFQEGIGTCRGRWSPGVRRSVECKGYCVIVGGVGRGCRRAPNAATGASWEIRLRVARVIGVVEYFVTTRLR